MHVDLYMNVPLPMKRGLNASTKSIDPGQPVQSSQAALDRNFLPLVNFQHMKEPH